MEKIKYQSDNDYNKNGDKLEDKNLKKWEIKKIQKYICYKKDNY